MDIDHLDGGELLERAPRGQSWCQCMEATLQRDLQTIGQERDEDVGFDPALVLMEDGPYRQVTLQVLERLFDAAAILILAFAWGPMVILAVCGGLCGAV